MHSTYVLHLMTKIKCRLVQPLWRTVWRFLTKLGIKLPYDPTTPLLGTCSEKTTIQKDTCTPVFIAALFIIARTWKQPRYWSIDEWMKKIGHIGTMEDYSAMKRNEFESVVVRWMNLEPLIGWSKPEREKQVLYSYSIYMESRKNGIHEPSREQICGPSRGRWRWGKL